MSTLRDRCGPLLLLCAAALLPGCAAVVVGAGAAAGISAAQDRRTTGTQIDDEIIESKAAARLREDPELLEQSHISSTSINGVLLLTGEAPTETLRSRATGLVQDIEKVRRVHNEVVVAAPSSMLSRSNDALVTTKVKARLAGLDFELANRVKVVTEAGSVFLMGLVTRAEAAAVTEAVRRVSGVQRVVKVFEFLD